MAQQIEYISENIDVELIRKVATLDDEALRLCFCVMICEWLKGAKFIPTKQAKVRLAKALREKGVSKKRVSELTNISTRTIYRLGHENDKR
nr:hypothetical protein [uncultured Campylobacter sp.]